jgi:cold shock CspA family protein
MIRLLLVQLLLLAEASDAWGWVGQSLPAPRGCLSRQGLHPVSKSPVRRLSGGAICLRASGGKAWSRPGGSAGGDKGIEQILEGKVKFFNQEKGSGIPTLIQPSSSLLQQHNSPPSQEATPTSLTNPIHPFELFTLRRFGFIEAADGEVFVHARDLDPSVQKVMNPSPQNNRGGKCPEKKRSKERGGGQEEDSNGVMPAAEKKQGKLTNPYPGDF